MLTVVLVTTPESPLDCKGITPKGDPKGDQSILNEISPDYSLEGFMLRLKLQYSGLLMWRNDSLGKTLMLGKIEGRRKGDDRGWDGWMASLTQWTWVWASSRSWWWTGKPGVLQSIESQRFRHNWVTELTELLSHVWFFVTPWTAASQAPLSMWFSREEYWSGLPCPPWGLLTQGLN